MNTFEEDATQYERFQALKAHADAIEKSLKTGKNAEGKKYTEGEKIFLTDYAKDLRKEADDRSKFTLKEAIDELGFCYDVGTKIKYIIASDVSRPKEKDYQKLHKMYTDWFLSVSFVILGCPDIYNHYINLFVNAGVNHLAKAKSASELADLVTGKTPPNAEHDLEDLDLKLDKLEEIMFRLEDKANIQIRQEIAKQEHDASTKYELRYSNARELTLNGILLAHPDFLSENDQFLSFIFEEGNAWRNIPTSELLEHMKVSKLSKTIHQILSDLNITGTIKDVFIPNVSTKGFEFRNPISHGFADENGLPVIDLKPVRNNKK